jgi:serralysin
MCFICAATQTFNPLYHPSGSDGAIITEVTDAPASLTTPYSIAVGDTFLGSIGTEGDDDVISIELEEGDIYTALLTGDTLDDPRLAIVNADGVIIGDNDDINGTSTDSGVVFTAAYTGTYYVAILASPNSTTLTGSYTASVSEFTGTLGPEGTLEELADYLINGNWQDTGTTARSFDTSSSNVITVNLSRLSEADQQMARWAMEAWELVADLEFEEVGRGNGAQIRFRDDGERAFAFSITDGTTITRSVINVSATYRSENGTTLDSYSFATYIHELGHALGLGHLGNYNSSASFGFNETFRNDSWQMSVMSYFNQAENFTTDASYANVVTAMMADILAIQTIYGASDVTSGDTIWGQGTTVASFLQEIFDAYVSGSPTENFGGDPIAFTIFDAGGIDTLNLSFSTGDDRIDLRDGRFSDVDGLVGNIGIARGTVLERLITGSGDDEIRGNAAHNFIRSKSGDDLVFGAKGQDTLIGARGQDSLAGGNGRDILRGGRGQDTLLGGRGDDTLTGGGGADTFAFTDSAIGADIITDYEVGVDALRIDDALWGGTILSAAQVVSTYASVVNGNVVFDFGNGNTITLDGVSSLDGLAADLTIL